MQHKRALITFFACCQPAASRLLTSILTCQLQQDLFRADTTWGESCVTNNVARIKSSYLEMRRFFPCVLSTHHRAVGCPSTCHCFTLLASPCAVRHLPAGEFVGDACRFMS